MMHLSWKMITGQVSNFLALKECILRFMRHWNGNIYSEFKAKMPAWRLWFAAVCMSHAGSSVGRFLSACKGMKSIFPGWRTFQSSFFNDQPDPRAHSGKRNKKKITLKQKSIKLLKLQNPQLCLLMQMCEKSWHFPPLASCKSCTLFFSTWQIGITGPPLFPQGPRAPKCSSVMLHNQ